jgi:hypothetical protein
MSGDERQDVLAVLRDVQERLDRQGARYWNETRALSAERGLLRAERDSLLLRGKDAGVSHTDMAKVLGETRQQVQVYVQEAQQAESNAFSQLVEDARVDGLMRDRGITEAEARTIVYEERDAASRAASKARQAKEAELVAFVEEIGDGLKLRDDRASEILYRVEQGWSDRKLARLVERLFHGQLHDRRTEVAERVIAFAREQSVPATSPPRP